MSLGVFYQQGGQLLAAIDKNDSLVSWETVTVQSVGGMAASPAAIVWNNYLHVFHQGGHANDLINPGTGTLWYSYFDGANWQPDTQVLNVGMSESPAPVVYNGDLYVFHQGGYENGELWYSAYLNEQGWQPDTQLPNVAMSLSPSAVSWPGADGQDLYVFHQGGYENGELWYSAYLNGQGWQPDTQLPNVAMSGSPSAVVCFGNLYVFHEGGYNNGQLWYSAYIPGQGWQPDTQVQDVTVPGGTQPGGVLFSPAAIQAGDLHVYYPLYPTIPEAGNAFTGLYYGKGLATYIAFSIFDGTNWIRINNPVEAQTGFVSSDSVSPFVY